MKWSPCVCTVQITLGFKSKCPYSPSVGVLSIHVTGYFNQETNNGKVASAYGIVERSDSFVFNCARIRYLTRPRSGHKSADLLEMILPVMPSSLPVLALPPKLHPEEEPKDQN